MISDTRAGSNLTIALGVSPCLADSKGNYVSSSMAVAFRFSYLPVSSEHTKQVAYSLSLSP